MRRPEPKASARRHSIEGDGASKSAASESSWLNYLYWDNSLPTHSPVVGVFLRQLGKFASRANQAAAADDAGCPQDSRTEGEGSMCCGAGRRQVRFRRDRGSRRFHVSAGPKKFQKISDPG